MKLLYRSKIINLIAVLACLAGSAFGQAGVQPGNFRFVNAAGVAGKVFLTIDAQKLKPEGYAAGDTTGAIGIPAGAKQFTVASAEAGTATATLTVQPNSSVTMIAYCQVTVDPQTRRPKKAMQLLERTNPPVSNGKHFRLLYVSSQPTADVVVNGAPKRVNAMREMSEQELPGAAIKVEQAGNVVVTFDAPQAGNFLVILYDDSSGKLAGVVLPDYK